MRPRRLRPAGARIIYRRVSLAPPSNPADARRSAAAPPCCCSAGCLSRCWSSRRACAACAEARPRSPDSGWCWEPARLSLGRLPSALFSVHNPIHYISFLSHHSNVHALSKKTYLIGKSYAISILLNLSNGKYFPIKYHTNKSEESELRDRKSEVLEKMQNI